MSTVTGTANSSSSATTMNSSDAVVSNATASGRAAGAANKRKTSLSRPRLDPMLRMSTKEDEEQQPSTTTTRRTSSGSGAHLPSRRSSDRLSRVGSSGNVPRTSAGGVGGGPMNARSKSYTQILQAAAAAAATAETAGKHAGGGRGRKSISAGAGAGGGGGGTGLAEKRAKNVSQVSLKAKRSSSKSAANRKRLEEEEEKKVKEDEGWASATDESSAAEESQGNRKGAKQGEEESDSDDDALVVGIKKKPSKLEIQQKQQRQSEEARGEGEALRTPLARPQELPAEPDAQLLLPAAAGAQPETNPPQTPTFRPKQLAAQQQQQGDVPESSVPATAFPTRMERAESNASDRTLAEGISNLLIDPASAGQAAQQQQRVAFPSSSTTSPVFPSRTQQQASSSSSNSAVLRSPTTARMAAANSRSVSSPLARDHTSFHEDSHHQPPTTSDSATTSLSSPHRQQPHPYRASYAGPEASPAGGASVRSSKLSVRSRTSSLLPRDQVHVAAPILDRHNALAGVLGSQYEDRPGTKDMRRASTMGPDDYSRSAIERRSSISNFPNSSSAPRRGNDDFDLDRRRRHESTQSLTSADAAKLAAQLRKARDHLSSYAEDDWASGSAAAAGTLGAGGAAATSASARLAGKLPELRAEKPIISTFAKPSFGVSAVDSYVQTVNSDSLWAEGWSHAKKVGDQPSPTSQQRGKKVRYVLPYGLGGPPVEKNALTEALLAPAFEENEFESSWAPALANAAGLGSRSARETYASHAGFEQDGIPAGDAFDMDGNAIVNGPNSTPLHIIHGLTSITDDPFPLEASDLQAGSDIPAGQTMLVKPSTMRAIALTVQAQAVHRQHTVTRRFADPMRESLERVAQASGKWSYLARSRAPPTPSASIGRRGGNLSGLASPGGYLTNSASLGSMSAAAASLAARKSAPSSPAFRDSGDSSGSRSSRPGLQRSSTGGAKDSSQPSYAAQLVDAAEHPVRSLKRVWSGGLARGGLAALTSTAEER